MKFAHFLPLSHPFTAKAIASAVIDKPETLSSLLWPMQKRVGTLAYKLELPAEARIHPVFHVSQLKKTLGRPTQVQHQVTLDSVEQILEPEVGLERR